MRTVYEAFDGKTFETQEECELHEFDVQAKARELLANKGLDRLPEVLSNIFCRYYTYTDAETVVFESAEQVEAYLYARAKDDDYIFGIYDDDGDYVDFLRRGDGVTKGDIDFGSRYICLLGKEEACLYQWGLIKNVIEALQTLGEKSADSGTTSADEE